MDMELEKKTKGHSEFDLVLVLILIGLLGIGAFIYVLKDNFFPNITPFSEEAPVGNTDDVAGRDHDKLGLRIDTELGKFFIHPETKKTLYINIKGECYEECLVFFEPLYAAEIFNNNEGLYTISRPDGTHQYSWKGRGLYTFKEDEGWSTLAHKYPKGWIIARP